jgi:chromate reductase
MHILGLSGSLRRGSYNTTLLSAASRSLPQGVKLEVYERLADLPHYNADLDTEKAIEPVARLRTSIAAADAVLIATPEFNGSIPGALKNALDWASRPFPGNALRHNPVAVIGASDGLFGAVWAQAETRKVLGIIGADVLDVELPVAQAYEAFGGDGQLIDPRLRAALANVVGELVATSRSARRSGSRRRPARPVATPSA